MSNEENDETTVLLWELPKPLFAMYTHGYLGFTELGCYWPTPVIANGHLDI